MPRRFTGVLIFGGFLRNPWRRLVALLLAMLVVLGAVTVARFHVWAEVDERAYYAVVQSLAEDGRLPQITDIVSPEVQAITDSTWPAPSLNDPAGQGLAGRNYEAFQPPLYSMLAVPAFVAGGDHRHKVFALRTFDLVLLAVAAWLLLLLARRELPEAPLAAFSGALIVLLWPAVLVRTITINNLPLELVLTTALLLALSRAHRERDGRWLVAAGALLGACLLTKLTLAFLAAPFAGVLWTFRRQPRTAAIAAMMPVVVFAPWLVSNVIRFGTLTANAAARRQQEPFVYPAGNHLGAGDLPDGLWRLTDGVLPLEWIGQLDVAWIRAATLLLLATLVASATSLLLRGSRSILARLTLAAAGGYLAMAAVTLVVSHWDLFFLRYAYAVLPPLALAATAGLWRRAGDRASLVAVAASALVLAALWVDMAGRFYFTDVGHRLGI